MKISTKTSQPVKVKKVVKKKGIVKSKNKIQPLDLKKGLMKFKVEEIVDSKKNVKKNVQGLEKKKLNTVQKSKNVKEVNGKKFDSKKEQLKKKIEKQLAEGNGLGNTKSKFSTKGENRKLNKKIKVENDDEIKSTKLNKKQKRIPKVNPEENSKVVIKSEKKKQKVITKKPLKNKKDRKLNFKKRPIIDLDELKEKYNIATETVKTAVEGVTKFVENNPKLKNTLFNERFPLFLQVNCLKVPRCHQKIIRIPLKHTLLTPDDEVCLIVSEVKGIKNIDHEKHVEHYEELLRKHDITNIKKIMTYHELRTEYDTFELKKRLVDLYDVFLADSKISGMTIGKCGQIFYKKRKVPNPVKLQASKLKQQLDMQLTKTQFHLHNIGDSYIVQFGHNKMNVEDLIDNAFAVIQQLNSEFPGGLDNIRRMEVYATRGISIPVYLNLKSPNAVRVPRVRVKRPKAYKTYTGELSTRPNVTVTVRPSGRVLLKRVKKTE